MLIHVSVVICDKRATSDYKDVTYPLQISQFYLTFKYDLILFFHMTVSCPSGNLFYFYLIPTTILMYLAHQFSSVQSLSPVQLFATPWTAAHQTSLSITNSQSLLKLMSIESVMPSKHLILCIPFSSHLQSFRASGSFPTSQFLHQVAKVLEYQLQHQSFQ